MHGYSVKEKPREFIPGELKIPQFQSKSPAIPCLQCICQFITMEFGTSGEKHAGFVWWWQWLWSEFEWCIYHDTWFLRRLHTFPMLISTHNVVGSRQLCPTLEQVCIWNQQFKPVDPPLLFQHILTLNVSQNFDNLCCGMSWRDCPNLSSGWHIRVFLTTPASPSRALVT